MIKSKEGSTWAWIITLIILIVVGVGVYFWLSGGDTNPVISNPLTEGPIPPALP